MSTAKRNKGKFAGIPDRVMKSEEYKRLSGSAVKLLLAMAYQYNGRDNNGDLNAAFSYLKEHHGFRSEHTVCRATRELLNANMIVQTRQAVFQKTNNMCALFALSWMPIDHCKGKLDVAATKVPANLFARPVQIGPNNKLK